MDLVSLAAYTPNAIIDLRYATDRNIAGEPLTSIVTPMLHRPAAEALLQVEQQLAANKLRLVIWDAYRTSEVQATLRRMQSDDKYVLEDSNHQKGLAIDVSLADMQGELLDMATDHDDFSDKAHSESTAVSPLQAANRKQLAEAMVAHGFQQWPYEWWHFDFIG